MLKEMAPQKKEVNIYPRSTKLNLIGFSSPGMDDNSIMSIKKLSVAPDKKTQN